MQRSGTKWWYRMVCDHPQVEPAAGKELHYFDAFHSRDLTDADVRSYHRMFPRPAGALTGEWTPRYMHDFWTPGLLARAAPEAKVLVLLRDPWERFRSGLVHEQRVFRWQLRGRRGAELRPVVAGEALDRSLYHRQLVRLLDHFDSSQVLMLQYERCVSDPASELRRTYRFLGLEHVDHVPAALEVRVGRSSVRHGLPPQLEHAALRAIADDARLLAETVPELDLSLWPSCGSQQSHGDVPAPSRR